MPKAGCFAVSESIFMKTRLIHGHLLCSRNRLQQHHWSIPSYVVPGLNAAHEVCRTWIAAAGRARINILSVGASCEQRMVHSAGHCSHVIS